MKTYRISSNDWYCDVQAASPDVAISRGLKVLFRGSDVKRSSKRIVVECEVVDADDDAPQDEAPSTSGH